MKSWNIEITLIVCNVSLIVCVALCAVFCLRVVCYLCDVYFCVLCLFVVTLPPGSKPFAVQLNNNNNNNTTLYPQKLAITSPTSGGRSVGIVRLWTKATD
jgi:hypothetical protein